MMQIASYNNSSEASRPTVRLKRLEDDEAMSHYIPSKSGTFIVSVEEKQPTPKPNSDWNPVYEDISDEDNAPSDMVTCLPNIEMQPKAILTEDIVVQKTGEKRRHSDPVNLNMSKKPRRRKRRWSFNSNADVNEPLRKRYNNRMMIAKEYNKYKSFILVGDSPVHETGYDTEPDIESLVKKEYCYDDEQSEERFADEAPTMNDFAGDEQTRKRLVDGEPTNNNGLDDEHTKERLESSTNKASDKKTEKRLGDRASANDASGDKQIEERLVDGEPTTGSNKASDEQTEKRLGDRASTDDASGDKQTEERLVDEEPTINKVSDEQSDRASTDDASGDEKTEERLVDRETTSNMVSDEQTDKRLGDRALTDGASAVVIDIEDEDTIDAPTNFGAPKEEIKNEKVDGYKSSYKQKLETTFEKMFSSGNFSDYKSSFKKDEGEAYCGKVKTDDAEGYKKCDVSVKIKKEHERDNKMVNKTVEIASKDMSIDDENDVVILETIKHPTNVKNKPINFNIRNSNSQGASARRNAPLIIITEAPCATVTDDLEPNDICQQEVNKRDKERAREKETDVNNKEKVREKETDVNNVHPIKDKVQSSKTNSSKTERKSKFSECSENKNDISKDIKKTSMKRKVRNSRRSFRHSSIEMFQVSKEPHVPWSYADKKLHASQDKSSTNHQSNLEKVIITDPEDDAPSPGSLTIDLDDTNKNTDVEDNSILKEKSDVETPEVVSHEVNDSQNSKVLNTSVVSNKKTTKPGTVDNSQSEDLDSVGEACEEEANKITKTSKRTHTGDSKVMKELVQQHLISDMEEKDRRLAKEFPRYNWLEEKIRNRSLAPNKYSEEPPTKKTKPSPPEEKAQQETPQEDPVSIQARKPVIVTMKSTDISPLLEHLTTTGDLEVTLSTPPAASSTASVDSGVSVRTQSESEQCDTPLVSVQAVIAPKPPQPLMSPIELQSQQLQELPPAPPLPPPPPLQPQPQLPFPQSPTMKNPSVRKVGDNAENSSDRASVVVPPLPERVMYSDRIATMARHAATSFDTGLVGPAAMLEDAHRNHRRFQRPPDPTTNNMLQQAQKAALLQAPQIPQQSSNEANYQQVGSHPAATLPDSSLRTQVIKPSAQYATNFQPPVHPPYAPPPQLGRALLPPFGYPGPHTGNGGYKQIYDEERFIVSVWVHEKERSGETYEEIRENFFLRLNKAAPSEANLRKLEKKSLNRLCIG
ncbi:hypothetical protein C0J52_16037 [Blattella germanica]|nr:hypothetical protein C0J52_16037 [Blattella germanica]